MLIFDRPNRAPAPSDLVWVFRGRELVGSLLGSPGAPMPYEEVAAHLSIKEELIPVGYLGDDAVFAGVVDDPELDVMRYVGTNLFGLIGRIDESMFDAIGRSYQLLNWDRDHRHCGRCGSTTQLADKGQCRQCETCNLSVYPRLSPCVIVLVTRGGECLLAAAAGGNRRFYSALAGFVEPGETCEQAVAREVMEEVGLKVGNIKYFGSQPWPFPGQLMLGFTAEWEGGEIDIDPEEIDEALWCTPDRLPPVPPPFSIAGQLINSFVRKQTGG